MKLIEMAGKQFGRLEVLHMLDRNLWAMKGRAEWVCECDCGEITFVCGARLRKGGSQSCGCLGADRARERLTRHGHAARGKRRIPEYNSWKAMRDRCLRTNNDAFAHYGGRGITICERWQSFESFLADIGPKTRP